MDFKFVRHVVFVYQLGDVSNNFREFIGEVIL